ncbi:MAG: proprotein convertase P-domain-containing protein, partial [Candidatus Hydrogenedentes bacterium]|nr:proprotein convertase P-domain-containing protein [Candidatus Hydrogenedentota bacterium]
MVNGKIQKVEGESSRTAVPVNGEIKLNQILGANEVTIEINPVFPDHVIAGANNNGGQEMYYSDNGGLTWSIAGVLPSTCCDPTVGWSSDGLTAYAGSLSFPGIGVNFYKSTNFGHTWGTAKAITSSGSDKEFLHVDVSSSSSFKDNIYLTYHDNNVMQFARSTNGGTTFTITSFGAAPTGIGSDITTDPTGNIYYCYAAFSRQIILLKSTNGGTSFGAAQVIATTNAQFDYPIPSMESRRAWTYAACDADRSGGPFDGSVYVSWTDTTAADVDNNASANHTQVKVAFSRNGGTTWFAPVIPHETADVNTVDRFNQWITVDEGGVVHVVYYDTRHSLNRTGVDLYYTFSQDGGVTWNTPARISSQTSANLTDGQEWGDYNGVSVLGARVLPAWTDNRDGPPNSKDVYVADVVNVAAEPGFLLSSPNNYQYLCKPGALDFTIDVAQAGDFSSPVTLSFVGLPAGITGSFVGNPVTPPGQATAHLTIAAGAAIGENDITIQGTATGAETRQLSVVANISAGTPGAPALLLPANGDPKGGFPAAGLSWTAVADATEYRVQVDTSLSFTDPFIRQVTTATEFNAEGLTQGVTYYWRVAGANACGRGAFASAFSFIADTNEVASTDVPKSIPDNNGIGVNSVLTFPDSLIITDVNVKLNITHTWDADLAVMITPPGGSQRTLFTQVGGDGDNFNNTILDDEAATTITSGTAPFAGSFRPQNVLSAFDGLNAQGTWTLRVVDAFSEDTGTLNSWSVIVTGYSPLNP